MAVNKLFFNAASEFSIGNITERFPTFQIEDINIGIGSCIHNEKTNTETYIGYLRTNARGGGVATHLITKSGRYVVLAI